MKKKKLAINGLMGALLLATAPLASCSSSSGDNGSPVDIVIPDDDDECCSLTEELATNNFLKTLHEVEGLGNLTVSKYTVKVYAAKASLTAGYNDLYFTVVKTETGRHVKDIAFHDITAIMTMGSMNNMQHSTPIGTTFAQVDDKPVYRGWVSFLMPSSEEQGNTWNFGFYYRIRDVEGSFSGKSVSVSAAPDGTAWVKSFKVGDDTYYLSLVNPTALKTGINTLQAYISKKAATATLPYTEAKEQFTVEIVPTMPDMGNHSSPNNEPLTRQPDGIYEGKLNLTMTGVWNIRLVVKNAAGETVAGSDNDESGYSSLYWTVSI